MFKIAPKKVYRSFKGEGTKPLKEIPTKDETANFWEALWGNPVQHKEETLWMKMTVEEYCQECEQKEYEISDESWKKY